MFRRRLYAEDGRFELNNLQDWQHSAMYAAFLLSGIADLLGHVCPENTFPEGVEHVSKALPSQLVSFTALVNLAQAREC